MHVINYGNTTLVFSNTPFAEEMLLWFKERVEWRTPSFQIPRLFAVGVSAEQACEVSSSKAESVSEIKSLKEMGSVINWLLDI